MIFEAKNYDRLIGTPGFSDVMLKNHFTLYQGYVKNVNALLEKMSGPDSAELRRRFGWEFNGMRLHELYFGNMKNGGAGTVPESIAGMLEEFKAVGMMRGIGWAVLCRDTESGALFNVWINEHDVGHLAGATPVLVMDVFEHAYATDYGIKRADYVEAFMAAVDWNVVGERISNAECKVQNAK